MIFKAMIVLMTAAVSTAAYVYVSHTTDFPENIDFKKLELTLPHFSFSEAPERPAPEDIESSDIDDIDNEGSSPISEPMTQGAPDLKNIDDVPSATERSAAVEVDTVIAAVMNETELLQVEDMRDRAYMGLVNFTLQHKRFDAADAAIERLVSDELKATAKGQMAVAYARAGNIEKALATVDSVEIEELHDIMRLQVLETLMTPDSYPYQ